MGKVQKLNILTVRAFVLSLNWLLFAIIVPSAQGQGVNNGITIYGQCRQHLIAADMDQNQFLAQTEFLDFVNRLTYGAIDDVPFNSLGVTLQTVYNTRTETEFGIPVQTPALDDICESTILGVIDSLGINVNLQRCFLFMSIGDQNKNNGLTRQEFSRFVNPLSQNLYGIVPFNTLPLPVQAIFGDFADPTTDVIDVTGTRPGTQPTDSRLPILTSLCRQTLVAIEAGKVSTITPPTDPLPAFVLSFPLCKTAMAASDLSKDEQLDTAEYARFLNIISGNKYPARNYDLLPEILQGNFVQHSNSVGAIPIAGSKPGSTVTADQEVTLQAFCDATAFILGELFSDSQASATASPTPGEVQAYPYTQCTLSMATSDGDRSVSLSSDEYVSFLNKMESFAWRDEDGRNFPFVDLPQPLQINFDDLSKSTNNRGIDIAGSFPGTPPTDEQRAFLEKICFDTALSVDASLYPNKYGIPTDLNSTFTGNISIYNAFILSTITTSSLDEVFATNETLYENLLEMAYGAFIRQAVNRYESVTQTFAKYRVVEDTEELYLFEDIICPENDRNLTLTSCQIVYSMFQLNVQYETNVSKLEDELTMAMQLRMSETDGGIESFIDALQPNSRLIVVGIPEDGRTRPSTSIPDVTPKNETESGEGTGMGLIMGIVIGGIVLCGCGGYFFMYGNIPDVSCPDMSGLFRWPFKSSKQNKTKDDDSDVGPVGFTDTADEESPMDFARKEPRKHDDDNDDESSHNFGFDDFRRSPTKDNKREESFRRRKQDSDDEGSQSEDNSGYGDSDSESEASNNKKKNTKGGGRGGSDSDSDSYGSDYSDGF